IMNNLGVKNITNSLVSAVQPKCANAKEKGIRVMFSGGTFSKDGRMLTWRKTLEFGGFNLSLETSTWFGEQEDRVSIHVLLKVIANACKAPTTFVSDLTESEDLDECVKHFDEDQELEQLISREICFKVYPFSSETNTSNTERKIMLSGSFNPLHEGHLKLLEVATRYINLFVDT
ncbi:hypothetical protein LOK49_LG10G02629, partial [Camellia lanceoleosa]